MTDLGTPIDLSSPPLILDEPNFLLKIYPELDFAEYMIKNDTVLNEDVARATKKMLEETLPGRKYFLLVSCEGFFRVTRKARRLGADKEFSAYLTAVGCYTNNPSLSLIGELYNKINKPAVPTQVFPRRENALEWLKEMMMQTQAGS